MGGGGGGGTCSVMRASMRAQTGKSNASSRAGKAVRSMPMSCAAMCLGARVVGNGNAPDSVCVVGAGVGGRSSRSPCNLQARHACFAHRLADNRPQRCHVSPGVLRGPVATVHVSARQLVPSGGVHLEHWKLRPVWRRAGGHTGSREARPAPPRTNVCSPLTHLLASTWRKNARSARGLTHSRYAQSRAMARLARFLPRTVVFCTGSRNPNGYSCTTTEHLCMQVEKGR